MPSGSPSRGAKQNIMRVIRRTNVKLPHHKGPLSTSEKQNLTYTLQCKTIRMWLYNWKWQNINKISQKHPMSKPKLMLIQVGWESNGVYWVEMVMWVWIEKLDAKQVRWWWINLLRINWHPQMEQKTLRKSCKHVGKMG
jgi:hypothetical protein